MVEDNGSYKHGSYESSWLKSLPVMPNIKVFAMQDGQTTEAQMDSSQLGCLASQAQLITLIHMLLI